MARRPQAVDGRLGLLPELLLAGAVVAGAMVIVLAARTMGLWVVLPPIYTIAVVGALLKPRHTAVALLLTAMVLEPQQVDFSKWASNSFFEMPPGFEKALPLTTSPLELLLVVLAASVYIPGRRLRATKAPRLPLLVWAVPLVAMMGVLYGMRNGAPMNFAYIEARGIFYGCFAFVIARRLAPDDWWQLGRWVMVGSGLLAAMVLMRYVAYIRTGNLNVPIESAFAHETPLFMAIGLLIACAIAVRHGRSPAQRLGLLVYCLVILAAMIATQRRAATVVGMVGLGWLGFSFLPKRPVLVTALGIPLLLAGGAYTAVFWNTEYGALAQPARAIRSQIDPSPRDQSSDEYREIERANVIQTLRLGPMFGVGFGRQFAQFQPLPDLRDFWPMQQYTPHQNVLWLWLKMGLPGITVLLSVAVLAVARAMAVARGSPAGSAEFIGAAVLSGVVLMYLVYGSVDLAFVGTRSMGMLAAAVGLALSMWASHERRVRSEG